MSKFYRNQNLSILHSGELELVQQKYEQVRRKSELVNVIHKHNAELEFVQQIN